MARKRVSSVESQRRIEEAMSLLLMGLMRPEIVAILCPKWGCKIDNVDAYIQKAKKQFHEHWSEELSEDIKAKHNMLYKTAVIQGDRKEARANLECLARLSGFNKDKIDHSGSVEIPTQIIIRKLDDKETN